MAEDNRIPVTLVNKNGEGVHQTEIPPEVKYFPSLPDVIRWGERTFVLRSGDTFAAEYREALTYVITDDPQAAHDAESNEEAKDITPAE